MPNNPGVSKPEISIVVPVYGRGDMLAQLHARLHATLADIETRFELILVDDRGHPAAWANISALTGSHGNVIGLRLGRNFGQHAATLCGIQAASGYWIVTMDDDLEHPPEAVPLLLAAGDDEHPLVYGVFAARNHPGYRNLSSHLMRWTLKKAFPDLNESYCSFRAIHHSLASQLTAFRLHRPYIDGMLSWITSNVRAVEVEHGARSHGRSGYTVGKLLSHAVNIFITFSRLPLRIASYTGGGLALLSFVALLYIVYGKLSGQIVSPGYASLMCVVLFTCGIQLIILGVVGEYVGRLMSAAHQKPVYVVVERIQSASSLSNPNMEHSAVRGR